MQPSSATKTVLNSHPFRDVSLLSDVAGRALALGDMSLLSDVADPAPVLGDRAVPSIASCARTPSDPNGTIGTSLQDTASQRRQDSLLFVQAFLAATLEPSASGGGVSEQSTASSAQDGTHIVQFEVTVPDCCKEGETMTFVLLHGRSESTQFLAGKKTGDKFPAMFLTPILVHVVTKEGKNIGDEIEHNASDGNLREVTRSGGCEEGKPETIQLNVTPAMNKDDVASKATALSDSTLLRIDGLERGARGWRLRRNPTLQQRLRQQP